MRSDDSEDKKVDESLQQLPSHFTAATYRELNPDLRNLSDDDAVQHYILHGMREGRVFVGDEVPHDFHPQLYRHLNHDLIQMSDDELVAHYRRAGKRENRRYRDDLWDRETITESTYFEEVVKDLSLSKGRDFDRICTEHLLAINALVEPPSLVLVSHDHSISGATIFLLILAEWCVEHDVKIMLLMPGDVNGDVLTRYNIDERLVFNYRSDAHVLFRVLKRAEERCAPLFYFNSCNTEICRVLPHLPRDRVILHSHEVPEHYVCGRGFTPDFVVSSLIADMWLRETGRRPCIFPPLLTTRQLARIVTEANAVPPAASLCVRDQTRTSVAMCGQLSARKNFRAFSAAAALCPDIDFVWIGGIQTPDCFAKQKNVIHIPQLISPFSSLAKVDYFVLTSEIDPCPYVVLESLLLGLHVIAFEDNIFTRHDSERLNFTLVRGGISSERLAEVCRDLPPRSRGAPKFCERALEYLMENHCPPESLISGLLSAEVPSVRLSSGICERSAR
jgi:hypothetical protein